MRTIPRDKIILTAAAVLTAGVLLSRRYPQAGFYISLAGLLILLLSGLPGFIKGVGRYRSLVPLKRAWVALQGVELIVIINALVTHRMLYFFILLILAAEYFIYDSQHRR